MPQGTIVKRNKHVAPPHHSIAAVATRRFVPSAVQAACEEVVRSKLDGKKWSGGLEAMWAKQISEEIKSRVHGACGLVARAQRSSLLVHLLSSLWESEFMNSSKEGWYEISSPLSFLPVCSNGLRSLQVCRADRLGGAKVTRRESG